MGRSAKVARIGNFALRQTSMAEVFLSIALAAEREALAAAPAPLLKATVKKSTATTSSSRALKPVGKPKGESASA